MTPKQQLKEHQAHRAQVLAEAEREQQQLAEELANLRRSISNLQAQEPGDSIEAAPARVNKAALLEELQQAERRLVERLRDHRARQQAVERNLAKQAAFLEAQL